MIKASHSAQSAFFFKVISMLGNREQAALRQMEVRMVTVVVDF